MNSIRSWPTRKFDPTLRHLWIRRGHGVTAAAEPDLAVNLGAAILAKMVLAC